MKSIVRELQKDALDKHIHVTDLLRKALVVAKKLKLQEFEDWINGELSGYKTTESVPSYRFISGEIKAWNPYHGWIPIMFQKSENSLNLSKMPCGQPISEIEHLSKIDETKGGGLQMSYQPEIEQQIMEWMEVPLRPSLHISVSRLHGVLDVVRNTVLNWALKLEEDGILGENLAFSNEEKNTAARESYHVTNFYGPVSHSQVQQGSHGSTQNLTTTGVDVASLKELLLSLRSSASQIQLDDSKKSELLADILTLESQAKYPSPKPAIVKEGLISIRRILEGASGKIVADLIIKIGPFLTHLM